MIKIFHLFFLFFVLSFTWKYVFADNSIEIVTREQWWANEQYRYLDAPEWQTIIQEENNKLKQNWEYISDEHTIKFLWKPDYNETIENYLKTFFSHKRKISSVIEKENGRQLFWPISYSQKISWIIIHHTAWEYSDPYQSIREIYKYHTLDRKWWDIWYNFLIAADGTIFEGRAGWEMAVWAHTKRNNISNIWISLMWDYDHESIPKKQLESLEKLVIYLIEKYQIDIHQKKYFHKDCLEYECEYGIESELLVPLIAHRDSSTSTCPWEEGYKDFQNVRNKIFQKYQLQNINIEKFYTIFDKYQQEKLEYLYHQLVVKKQSELNFQKKMIYTQVWTILKNYLDEKYG